jgi:tetratricopeptide (TPR) repeat protein
MRTRITMLAAILVAACAHAAAAQPPQRSNPDDARAMVRYNEAWTLMRSEKYDEAIAEFRAALELNPKLNMAHYGIGRASMALHKYDEAITEYETCRDKLTARAGAKITGQFDASRAREDRMLELRDLQTQFSKGPQTFATQDVQRQIQNAMRITQNESERGMNVSIDAGVPAFINVALGSAYFRSERRDDAEKAYKAALNVDSNVGEAHNNLAVIYLLSGRISEAEAAVKKAEKAGFRVNPELKEQISAAMK